jgi:hypothetical protein
MLGKFAQEAVAALLRFSKSTSDPKLAARLVDKAAEMKDRADPLIGDEQPPAVVAEPAERSKANPP